MLRLFKRWGLLLSAAAILVTAALPFHHHKEASSQNSKKDCSVCSFAGNVRGVTLEAGSVEFPCLGGHFLLPDFRPQVSFLNLTLSVSPRAPPAA